MTRPHIRHRRLEAFYSSKTLNMTLIFLVASLSLAGCGAPAAVSVTCSSAALALFAGYSVWLWRARPRRVIVNRWLSDMSGWFVIYFLIVSAISDASVWWHIFPCVAAAVALLIALTGRGDEQFEI